MARRYADASRLAEALKTGRIDIGAPLLHRLTVIAGLEAAGLKGARSA
jgi:hypothetical protein